MEWNGHKILLSLKLPFLCASFPFQTQQNMLWYCNGIMATLFYAVRGLTRVRCREITRKGIFRGLSCLSGLLLNARFYRLTVDCKSMLTTKRCNKKEKSVWKFRLFQGKEGGWWIIYACDMRRQIYTSERREKIIWHILSMAKRWFLAWCPLKTVCSTFGQDVKSETHERKNNIATRPNINGRQDVGVNLI